MNTPNKLTLIRVILIPVFMFFSMTSVVPFANVIALLVFVLAFLTDMLDGYLARKNGQVTNFGKIMDPLADKLLVTAAMVCMLSANVISPWVAIVILAREFIVSGIRIAAAAEGQVIAASKWGKIKTVWQFIAFSVGILVWKSTLLVDVVIWIAVLLTIISGIDYMLKNAKHLSMK